MTQTIVFLVTLSTPNTDEPLSAVDEAKNCMDARIAITQAAQRAGFAVVAIEEQQ